MKNLKNLIVVKSGGKIFDIEIQGGLLKKSFMNSRSGKAGKVLPANFKSNFW